MKDQTLHFAGWVPNPIRAKAPWKRAPSMRRLLGTKLHNDPQPVPTTADAGTTRPSAGSSVVHQNGAKKRIPPRLHEGRRRMENSIQNLLRTIQIPGNAIWVDQCPIYLTRHDEPHVLRYVGRQVLHLNIPRST